MSNVHLTEMYRGGSYGSDFESDAEAEKQRKKNDNLMAKKAKREKKAHKRLLEEEYNKEERRIHRHHILSMDAYERHKMMVNNYLLYYGGSQNHFGRDTSKDRTDMDVIRENHKFLWTEEDEEEDTWEKRLAKKYYEKLFKEYCIADLSRYKENKIAMRWRIEKEVEEGKGQFICGNKKCRETEGLRSWEVNFAYMEHGTKRNALVKLRLCPDCSYKLNYHHKKKEVIPKKKKKDQTTSEPSPAKKTKSSQESRSIEDASQPSEASRGGNSDEAGSSAADEAEESIWSGPVKIVEEKSRDEEFDDYFADMFL